MFPFMFAVLGSVTFWVIYGLVTIVMAMVTMRLYFPFVLKALKSDEPVVKKGYSRTCYGKDDIVFCTGFCLLAWPLLLTLAVVWTLIYEVLYKLIFVYFFKGFRLLLCKVDDLIPIVKITKE